MANYTYANGEIVDNETASLSLKDLAFLRGYGVFDFFAFREGKFFQVERHLSRFRNSAKCLNLEISLKNDEIIEISNQLIEKSDLKNPAIRIFVTGGDSLDVPLFSNPKIFILAEECLQDSKEVYKKGISLVSFEFQRELPEVKTINYINSVRLSPWIKEQGADDVLYHQKGIITECPRANFFIFSGNKLFTPKKNILFGITREVVLKLASSSFEVCETDITLDEIYRADEAFITSSSKKIMPVSKVDKYQIGESTLGARVQKIMQLFEENLP